MIIGINGKIGVGKDLTGKIIQYLTLPTKHGPYIGFETFDDITLERNSTFKIKKFAGKLKQIASILTGIPEHMFEDQEFKKTDLANEWVYVKPGYPARNMTVRELLQKLGTDAMRDNLHENVWVNALFADYKPKGNMIGIYPDPASIEYVQEYPKWIITDTRFPNELEAVKQREGITIRVVRPQIETANFKSQHPSETSLDSAEFDYEIINDAGIPELIEKVRQILITEKII